MLNIYFGSMPEAVYNTAVYFKNTYSDSWITAPLAAEIIRDVDKSKVIGPQIIESPVLGMITPLQLSGGVKTLLLIANDKSGRHVFNASTCGDNCAKWLLKIAMDKKVVISLRHLMNFGEGDFRIMVMNKKKIAHNMQELVLLAGEYVRGITNRKHAVKISDRRVQYSFEVVRSITMVQGNRGKGVALIAANMPTA